jgi:Tol biopolymer transport system component
MLATFLLLAAVAAKGQPAPPVYDPQLAYVKPGSRTSELYLANADGSNAKRVLVNDGIDSVDLSPAGNLLAYSDAQGIKLLDFSAGANGITAGAPRLLVAGGTTPDFSEDGSRIIYRVLADSTVRSIPTTGGTPTTLFTGVCSSPRWLRQADMGNAFACWRAQSGAPIVYQAWVFLLDGSDQVVSAGPVVSSDSQPFDMIDDRLDVARTRNALLIVTDYPSYPSVLEVNLQTGATTPRGSGNGVHSSRGDTRILTVSPHSSSGDFIEALDVATGRVTPLTKKGTYGAFDAQP